MKHLLSIESLATEDLCGIVEESHVFKRHREKDPRKPLTGQIWALMFSKSSTRTRVSFEVGIRELGGDALFLSSRDIQLGRGEPIKDTGRVLGRMIHGAIIRTFDQSDVEDFARYSNVPTINALTDAEHPCQVIADLQTYQEKHGSIEGKVVTFVGDGACNMPVSWLFAAGKLGFEFRIAAPKAYHPSADIIQRAGGNIVLFEDPQKAAEGADVLYTDVWVSMGMEEETAKRKQDLQDYQINKTLVSRAKPEVMVMHCLPAYRGLEIDEETFEAHAGTIFDQAENRLHAQKAILNWIVEKGNGTLIKSLPLPVHPGC